MSRNIILLFLILFGFESIAQNNLTITGQLSSMKNPIFGAHIFINGENKIVAISDENGKFSISKSASSLQIYALGFQDTSLRLSPNDSFLLINLTPDFALLNQVVISENRSQQKITKSTVSIERIDPKLIAQLGPTNVQQTIERINGVSIVDNQPNIRAGGGWSYGAGSRVQVLVDDLPMLSGDAGQPQWSFIPTEGISSIEVIKGSASVLYGSAALNGVINIRTQSYADRPVLDISETFGFYDTPKNAKNNLQRNPLANISGLYLDRISNTDVRLSINGLYDKGYLNNNSENRLRVGMGLKKKLLHNKLTLGLNGNFQSGNSYSFLLWDGFHNAYKGLDGATTKNHTTRLNIDPSLRFIHKKETHSLLGRVLQVNNEVDNGNPNNDQSNSSNYYYLEYRYLRKLTNINSTLSGGLVWNNTQTISPLYSGIQTTSNQSFYVQIEKSLFNQLNLVGGGRIERFVLNDRVETKPVFRAGANWEVAKHTFVRTSFGQGYRYPSIAESFIQTNVGILAIFPNSNLQAETGNNIEIGLKQGWKVKKLEGFLDFAVFRMTLNNMMEFTLGQWKKPTIQDFGIGFKSLNTGKTMIQGIEVGGSFQYLHDDFKISGFIGYTLTASEALSPEYFYDTDSSGKQLNYINTSSNTSRNSLKYRPRNQIKADVMLDWKQFYFGAGFMYQSKMDNIDTAFLSFPLSAIITGIDTAMNQGLTQYAMINLRIGYMPNQNWRVGIIVDNATNAAYMVRPAYMGSPRTVRISVSYRLRDSKK